MKKYTKLKLYSIFIFTLLLLNSERSNAQLKIRTEKNFTKLVNEVLVSSGVSIRNVVFRGDTSAIGIFNAENTNLGIDSGIVIATGNVFNAIGPSSNNANTVASGVGDGDLNSILSQGITKDAASLQFEFSPASNTVKFKIVFASEEYPEFVNEPYNDVFGIFLSGPGITGKQNIANIPGTNSAISIKSINTTVNNNLFVDNSTGNNISYDGFTTVIEIIAENLTPCKPYVIKFAIADVEDQAYDSGIFIEALSFKSETSGDAKVYRLKPKAKTIQEKCDSAIFRFVRSSSDLTKNLAVYYDVTGTATMGADYLNINTDSIVIPAGSVSKDLVITPIDDNIVEADENVYIRITSNSICSPSIDSVVISDFDTLKITGYKDIDCNADTIYKLVKTSDGSSQLQFIWRDSLGNVVSGGPILIVAPDSLTMYIISIYDSCINHTTIDTIYVAPLIIATLSIINDTIVCPPTVLKLNLTSNVDSLDYQWTAVTAGNVDVGFFDDNTIMQPTYTVPSGIAEIFVKVEVTTPGVCADPVMFVIRTILKGIASKKPALICENGTVQLRAYGGETYSWRPSSGLNDTTIANPIASEERTYTVTITDSIGCARDYSIQVIIDTLPVANAGKDKIICARSSIQLQATGSEYNTYEWSPRASLNKWNIANPIATPDVTTTYYVKAINNLCTTYDSVTIYVVDIPDTKFDFTYDSCARIIAFSNKTVGTDSIVWDFGDGDTSLADNPIHKYDSAGTFTITLIANKNTNCSDTASLQITIPEIDINKRSIPNVFTPNNDGKNDTFKITGGNVECFIESISIYNRWGKLIYEVKNQVSWEWDGRINDEIVPPGTYFYSVKGKGFDDIGSFSVIY